MSFGIPVRNGLGLGLLASTTLATRNAFGPTPTLNLNFTTMTALPSTITFSRPSNATYYDSTGKLTYAPNNLATYSQDFTNAAWTKQTLGTVTADVAVAPDGTTTANKLFETAATSTFAVYRSAAVGYGRIFSLYVKAAERNYVQFYDPSTGTLGQFVVDLTTGLVTQNTASLVYAVTAAANGFYRISVVLPSATPFVGAAISATSTASSNFGTSYAGTAGYGIYIWGAQLEAVTYQTTPSTYVATTSAAYYGARLDYNPATLAARGLLIEEARTNYAVPSSNFNSWTPSNVTITANQTTSPDGTVSAALLNSGTATNIAHQVYSVAALAASGSPFTFSVYAKAGTGRYLTLSIIGGNTSTGGYAVFDLVGSTVTQSGALSGGGTFNSASITEIGNGFYRLTVTVTPATEPNVYIAIATSNTATYTPDNGGRSVYTGTGTTYYIWGAQYESGSFATSYIPTAGGTVSRSADTAIMTGTNFSSWYNATAGAVVVSWAYGMATASIPTYASAFSMTTSGSARQLMQDLGSATWYDGTTYINTGAHIGLIPNKTAFAYSNGDNAACLNGGTVATSSSPLPVTPNEATIGNQTGTSRYVNGWIASVVYYPQRLPNATLQSLTS